MPLIAVIVVLSYGLTVFAEETAPDIPQSVPTQSPKDNKDELFPTNVQTVIEDGTRQIIKTFILTAEQSPSDIPRDSFERDGWIYTLTDITEKRSSRMDKRSHTEIKEINTNTNDLNEIIKMLDPTLEYQSEDGYEGILDLEFSSVKCGTAGYKNSCYTVTATREYPNLSTNDLSLVPKTITDNGRTLQLSDISWNAQTYTNVDCEEIPASYRAVAKYTGSASKSVVTGYVTTAEYSGEIVKMITGDTIYTAYFTGREMIIAPTPTPVPTPTPTVKPSTPPQITATPQPTAPVSNSLSLALILTGLAVLVALVGTAGAFIFLRCNVKIYREGFSVLAAKDKISAKSPVIDLSPLSPHEAKSGLRGDPVLDGECFGIEIDKFAAKTLNGVTVEVRHDSASLKHQIAFEGSAYRIEADFGSGTIQAIY